MSEPGIFTQTYASGCSKTPSGSWLSLQNNVSDVQALRVYSEPLHHITASNVLQPTVQGKEQHKAKQVCQCNPTTCDKFKVVETMTSRCQLGTARFPDGFKELSDEMGILLC